MPNQPAISTGLFPEYLGGVEQWRATRLGGGANNKVCLLEKGSNKYILKQYAETDERDRYSSEKAFYEWTSRQALDQVPEALDWDDEARAALFHYIEGQPVPVDAGIQNTRQAAQFILDLNQGCTDARQLPIPQAADTGDWPTQFSRISARLRKLQDLSEETPLKDELDAFLEHELLPSWEQVSAQFQSHINKEPDLSEPLPTEETILSPSDIGFHNCLVTHDGRHVFFDFEYAGWDDPAKTAVDFLRQPRHDIAHPQWASFIRMLSTLSPDPDRFMYRTRRLAPLHNIKWCCIFLNEFLPTHASRRETATGQDPMQATTLRAQIAKARAHLQSFEQIPNESWPT